MLVEQSLPQKFWSDTVKTATYNLNKVLVRPMVGKTPCEIFKGRKPSVGHIRVFESICFILNTKDHLTKFDPKSYEEIFLGYSLNNKAYTDLNK